MDPLPTPVNQPAPGFFAKLRGRLKLPVLLAGRKLDEALLEELEAQLLTADVGVEASARIVSDLRRQVEEITDAGRQRAALKASLAALLQPVAKPLVLTSDTKPFVVLALGVNGVGKTTTLGKLARRFKSQGKNVMLAAADTFRAAATEQLQVWGERHGVPVIAQGQGADPAAVAHDAYAAAKAKGVDLLLVDTAGRLHNRENLMQELKKIARVLSKLDPAAPHERLLVLDAGTGQNALAQIAEFHAAVGLTGLVVTKLDGTAKGGILVAAAERFKIPVRYIGVGEAGEDLQEFDAGAYAAALAGSEKDA
ncbi:MAG TPA: signal recognition particle-docking protein FtsY [Gammaproteobacteria bacterium]|nr:signal recognition particle-docking protein FtsY [Gammaproteobacteria bacterium]